MAAMQQRKLREGLQLMKEAEKCMKTGWLKWKPDWDSAADKYMKAGNSFKAAKSFPEAEDAFKRAAEAHYGAHAFCGTSTFHSAKALEQAASVLKEMKRIREAVELVERAGLYYRESGSPDTAALALVRGAKMCEPVEPNKSIELFLSAGELNVGEDKIREGIEPMANAVRLLLKMKRYEEATRTMKTILDLYQDVENFAMMYKIVLSLIVVHLSESDYVAADKCFKDSCGIPGFTSSDEAEAAEKILDCFDQGDSDGIKTCTAQPLFTYLENEIAKLSRKLRAPGDIDEAVTQPVITNTVFNKPRNPESVEDKAESELDDTGESTESQASNLVEQEGEFAGGLC